MEGFWGGVPPCYPSRDIEMLRQIELGGKNPWIIMHTPVLRVKWYWRLDSIDQIPENLSNHIYLLVLYINTTRIRTFSIMSHALPCTYHCCKDLINAWSFSVSALLIEWELELWTENTEANGYLISVSKYFINTTLKHWEESISFE